MEVLDGRTKEGRRKGGRERTNDGRRRNVPREGGKGKGEREMHSRESIEGAWKGMSNIGKQSAGGIWKG